MKNSKFAVLDQEQIQELKQLEEKLEVTLLAYDQSVNYWLICSVKVFGC